MLKLHFLREITLNLTLKIDLLKFSLEPWAIPWSDPAWPGRTLTSLAGDPADRKNRFADAAAERHRSSSICRSTATARCHGCSCAY